MHIGRASGSSAYLRVYKRDETVEMGSLPSSNSAGRVEQSMNVSEMHQAHKGGDSPPYMHVWILLGYKADTGRIRARRRKQQNSSWNSKR